MRRGSAVTSVGGQAVTPNAVRASAIRPIPATSASRTSVPAKPLTWRSTYPGAAMPSTRRRWQADARDDVPVDLDVPGQQGAVDESGADAEEPGGHRTISWVVERGAARAAGDGGGGGRERVASRA